MRNVKHKDAGVSTRRHVDMRACQKRKKSRRTPDEGRAAVRNPAWWEILPITVPLSGCQLCRNLVLEKAQFAGAQSIASRVAASSSRISRTIWWKDFGRGSTRRGKNSL